MDVNAVAILLNNVPFCIFSTFCLGAIKTQGGGEGRGLEYKKGGVDRRLAYRVLRKHRQYF